jgi:hypothetical protein
MKFEDLTIGQQFEIVIPRTVWEKISETEFRSVVNGIRFSSERLKDIGCPIQPTSGQPATQQEGQMPMIESDVGATEELRDDHASYFA